jgi:hypothetical protein
MNRAVNPILTLLLTFTIGGCQSEAKVEQACFMDYLDGTQAAGDTLFTCSDSAASGEDASACSEDYAVASDGVDADLATCAGDGCVADWQACVDADLDSDIQCFDALDTCGGGWVNALLVDDCQTDAAACAAADSVEVRRACANDYFDCMRYAAGR